MVVDEEEGVGSMSRPLHKAENWNSFVACYERWVEPFTSCFARAALQLAGDPVSGLDVLDVACGTGAVSLLAAAQGARLLQAPLTALA